VGDRTSHGGVVITGSLFSDVDGKGIARIGDQVTCPQKGHGVNVIVTGDITNNIDGSPVARHGDKTACGATLISGQMLTYVDDGSSCGGNSTTGASSSSVRQSLAALTNDSQKSFNDAYQLVDEGTGRPLGNCEYTVKRDDGTTIYGMTDASGYTQKIGDTDVAENLIFNLGDWEA